MVPPVQLVTPAALAATAFSGSAADTPRIAASARVPTAKSIVAYLKAIPVPLHTTPIERLSSGFRPVVVQTLILEPN
jgi:hypothetical protein